MIEPIPFLPNSEGDTDILGRTLNELSHLSQVLSFLVRRLCRFNADHAIGFFLCLYTLL